MKYLLGITLALIASASASNATTYICEENLPFTEFEVLRFRKVVTVTELADITASKKTDADGYLYRVSVQIDTVSENTNEVISTQKIITTATEEDVNYRINSKKDNLEFWIFLDELDESGIKIKNKYGKTEKTKLSCTSDEQ